MLRVKSSSWWSTTLRTYRICRTCRSAATLITVDPQFEKYDVALRLGDTQAPES